MVELLICPCGHYNLEPANDKCKTVDRHKAIADFDIPDEDKAYLGVELARAIAADLMSGKAKPSKEDKAMGSYLVKHKLNGDDNNGGNNGGNTGRPK